MKDLLSGYLFPHPPIIVAEIGRGEEEKALKTVEGCKTLARDIKDKTPDTIIIITPHGPLFSDAISISVGEDLRGDFKNFGNNELDFSYKNNLDLVNRIIDRSYEENIPIAKIDKNMAKDYKISLELDHGALVPLYFIDKEYKNFKLVHITYGLLTPEVLYKFGNVIQDIVMELEEKVAFIASGDLSHKLSNDGPYEYSPSGEKFDRKLVEILETEDFESLVSFDQELSESAGECGLRSLIILGGFLSGLEIESEVLSYEGPFGVGYCNAQFSLIKNMESQHVRLARKSLEYYVINEEPIEPPKNLSDKLLNNKMGAFVTLKKHGILRGCIGSILPTQSSLAEEIIVNAISAGVRDPRFLPVTKDELVELEYSVDLLDSPEPITSIKELDTKKYGVIVSKDFRKALLLPNLEGVDTPEEQVNIALEKAGIKNHEDYKMERFKVTRYF